MIATVQTATILVGIRTIVVPSALNVAALIILFALLLFVERDRDRRLSR